MNYQITVRYGKTRQQYLSLVLEAPDAPGALREAADRIPPEVAGEVDLVELREAPDFDKRMAEGDRIG